MIRKKRNMKLRQKRMPIKSIILCWIALLSGCDTYMGGVTNSDVRMECPPVSILPEASSITRYKKGTRKTILDVDFTGRVIGVKGTCFYEFDPDTKNGTVAINVITKFKMKRGASNATQKADFKYFTSVVNNDGKVLGKKTFPYSLKFSKKRSWVKDEDFPIELIIPLKNETNSQNFTVFVGFQLSHEELEFNRTQGTL